MSVTGSGEGWGKEGNSEFYDNLNHFRDIQVFADITGIMEITA